MYWDRQPRDAAEAALDDARRLQHEGNFPAALERYIWFHDHALEIRESLYGVRLSFALRYWADLARIYPPAWDALRATRDSKEVRIRSGEVKRALFHDVARLNHYLDDVGATARVFKEIDATSPGFASAVYDLAEEDLVAAEEFHLAAKYLGDGLKEFEAAKEDFLSLMADLGTGRVGDAARKAAQAMFSGRVARIVTILRNSGNHAGAQNIEEQAANVRAT